MLSTLKEDRVDLPPLVRNIIVNKSKDFKTVNVTVMLCVLCYLLKDTLIQKRSVEECIILKLQFTDEENLKIETSSTSLVPLSRLKIDTRHY